MLIGGTGGDHGGGHFRWIRPFGDGLLGGGLGAGLERFRFRRAFRQRLLDRLVGGVAHGVIGTWTFALRTGTFRAGTFALGDLFALGTLALRTGTFRSGTLALGGLFALGTLAFALRGFAFGFALALALALAFHCFAFALTLRGFAFGFFLAFRFALAFAFLFAFGFGFFLAFLFALTLTLTLALALAFGLVAAFAIGGRRLLGRRRRQDVQDGRAEILLDLRLRENHRRRRRREGTGHLHRRPDRAEDDGRGVGIVGHDGYFADRLHALRIGLRQHGEGILGALLRRLADELGAANADGGDRRRHRHPLGSGLGDLAADEREHALHHIGMENARFGAGIVDHLVQHHLPFGAQREGRVVDEYDADGRPRTGLDSVALEQRVALGQGQPGAVGAHHLDAAISGLDAADGLGRRLRKIDCRQAGFAGNRRIGPGNGIDDLAVAVAANVTVFFSSMGHVFLQDQDSSRTPPERWRMDFSPSLLE